MIEPQVHDLAELGIPVVSPIRFLQLTDQLAQKLHACTCPFSAGRARDVLDILLIDILGELNYVQAAKAARRLFIERATHEFPPKATLPPEWGPELEALSRDLGFAIRKTNEIQLCFSQIVEVLGQAANLDA